AHPPVDLGVVAAPLRPGHPPPACGGRPRFCEAAALGPQRLAELLGVAGLPVGGGGPAHQAPEGGLPGGRPLRGHTRGPCPRSAAPPGPPAAGLWRAPALLRACGSWLTASGLAPGRCAPSRRGRRSAPPGA